ncbi:hypothetical protein JCM8547_007341 [Rhodosporidiobolus lusitaniae]
MTTPVSSPAAHPAPSSSPSPSAAHRPLPDPAPLSSTRSEPAHYRPRKRRKRSDDSWGYILTSGFAGGIAGCVAKTSVAPLDRVKILFQTRSPDYQKYAGTWLGVFRASKDIYGETGIRGLLQGHSATLLRIFPYAAIKFMAYDQLHSMLMPTPADETAARRFLAGATAGITTTAITYPLELIRVRLAFESHHSPTDRASLLRTIKEIYLAPLPPPSSSSSSSASVSASSASATTAAPSAPSPSPPSSSRPSLTHFYRGVFPTLFGIIPYAGTSFLVWGFLKTDLLPSYLSPSTRQQNRALLDLLSGGVAGAVGQTTAYPLDIVRRRMQVGPAMRGGERKGFWETAGGVWKAQGWRGFFVGLSIGFLKVIPMNAVSFATWVALKRSLGLDEEPQKPSKKEEDAKGS